MANQYMTPANQYQSVIPQSTGLQSSIYQAPIINQPVQTPMQSQGYPIGTNADGSVRYSNIPAPAPAPVQGQTLGAVDTFSPYLGSNATPSQSYSQPYTVGPTAAQRQMATDRQNLINQQTQQGLQFADQSYNDMNTNLNNQEGQIKTQYAGGKDYINQLRNSNTSDLTANSDLSKRQARQSYQDSILQTRIRARALGGAASSGFMDLTSRLDQALAGNLTNIDTTNMSAMNKVKLTADKALTDLQSEMDKSINEIANQKNLSLRERDKAKASIQMEAAQAALEIKSWLDGKTQTLTKTVKVGGTPNTIPSISEQAQLYKSNILNQFQNDLGSVKGAGINANSPEFKNAMSKYGPALSSVGVNPNTLTGYYSPVSTGYTPLTQQELDDLYKKSFYQGQGSYDAQNPGM